MERTDGAAVGTSEYPYETPHPLWSEQDPELWWRATTAAIAEAASSEPAWPATR